MHARTPDGFTHGIVKEMTMGNLLKHSDIALMVLFK